MKSLKKELQTWSTTNDSFTKLQHAYVAIAATALVAAGIIGLINYSLGQSILFLALCATLVFIGNGVVWALMRTFIVPSTDTAAPRTRKK